MKGLSEEMKAVFALARAQGVVLQISDRGGPVRDAGPSDFRRASRTEYAWTTRTAR